MGAGLAVAFLIDLIVTCLIAWGASWFFVSRHLARRTPDRLGRDDVALLRDMAMTLNTLRTLDEIAGEAFCMPAEVRHQVDERLGRYTAAKERPA